jgi:hypothetical protein
MKKDNFTLSVAATLLLLLTTLGKANAQTARLQLIHNAPAVALDTVDLYLDNTKFENVAFRTATQLLTVNAGAHTVNVNDRNSVDSGDMVLSRFALSVTANQNHIAMVAGLDVPANYDANPNAVATALSLIVRNNVSVSPASNTQTALNFFHGTTDAPTWDIYLRPSVVVANDAKYGDASGNITANSVSSVLDVRNSAGSTVVKAYDLPLNLFAKKSLVVFASGFRTPASNQNGAAFGVFVVDSNGGPAIMLSEVSRIQFINNSPDVIVDTVDVWIDNTKVVDNLAFRKASIFYSITPGMHDVTIAKKFSTDTSAAVVLFQSPLSFLPGATNIAVVKGVVDPAQYAPNPNGPVPTFDFSLLSVAKEGAFASQVDLGFFTGTHDLPTIDFNKISAPGAAKIANGFMYNTVAAAVSFTSGNMLFNLTSDDSSTFYGAYQLNGPATKSGIIMTSGVYNTTASPAGAKAMGLYAFFNDGTVSQLSPLSSDVQIVHNSPDVTNDSVDIYVNGVKAVDNIAYRTATTFMPMNAWVPYTFEIAPKGSVDASTAFYSTTITLDSNTNYYVIAAGVKNVAQYVANPNGRNIGFKLFTYKGARKIATNNKNTDLLYFHGSPDLMATTIIGVGQVQYLSKNDAYGDFHGYAIHSAQDNIRYDVMDAAADSVLKTVFGSISLYQGKAGLVFASGFLNANATTNQDGDTLILFVAWPDGNVDSIAPPKPITGLKEQSIAGSKLDVYPNPAKDVVSISLELTKQNNIVCEVIDITGKVVLIHTNQGYRGKNTVELNTAPLNNGMYFISIKVNDQVITKKIAISK